jgi:DNA repair photolyase
MLRPSLRRAERREREASSILTPVSGFLREAGFSHSLSPARNCSYGCTYCYVPTMRIQAGLQREDWQQWGRHSTFKVNAAALLRRQLRPEQVIYCSPLTDPWQPLEAEQQLMPQILGVLGERVPACVVLQTRSPLALRDLALLQLLNEKTRLRISFSLTTNDDVVRRHFEPHCESVAERVDAMQQLCAAGLQVSATLAPLLPCDPRALARLALQCSNGPVVVDPLHTRANKAQGATTHAPALRVLAARGHEGWLEAEQQNAAVAMIAEICHAARRQCGNGPAGFALLCEAQDRGSNS